MRRRTRWILTIALGLPAVALGVVLVWNASGARRVAALRRAIAARGEALTLAELEFAPPGAGADAREWLLQAGRADDCWGVGEIEDLEDVESALADEEFEPAARAALEELRDGLARGESLDGLWNPLARPVTPAAHALARAWRAANAVCTERALEACSLATFDGAALISGFTSSDEPMLDLTEESRGLLRLNRNLFESACGEALDGRPERALDLLEAHSCLSERMDPMPGQYAWSALTMVRSTTLQALRRALPHLPPDLDLSRIERSIELHDPHAALRRALIEERVLGMHAHGRVAKLAPIDSRPLTWLLRMFAARSEAWFLEMYERIFSDLERPYWQLEPFEPEPPIWAPVAAMLLPNIGLLRHMETHLEASRRLALLAITAHRDGPRAAEALAARTLDPFDGAPLRTRRQEGWLLIWSIGEDGTDDGGRLDSEEFGDRRVPPGTFGTDIAWHVPLRDGSSGPAGR